MLLNCFLSLCTLKKNIHVGTDFLLVVIPFRHTHIKKRNMYRLYNPKEVLVMVYVTTNSTTCIRYRRHVVTKYYWFHPITKHNDIHFSSLLSLPKLLSFFLVTWLHICLHILYFSHTCVQAQIGVKRKFKKLYYCCTWKKKGVCIEFYMNFKDSPKIK